jgi:hypothetical protein
LKKGLILQQNSGCLLQPFAPTEEALSVRLSKAQVGRHVHTDLDTQLSMDAAMLAHNLARELQFETGDIATRTTPTRTPAMRLQTLAQLTRRIVRRAGALTRPQSKLTLTISAGDEEMRQEFRNYHRELARAA